MLLRELAKNVRPVFPVEYTGNTEINDIVYDSRKAIDGKLFVCLRGTKSDGHEYASAAYENGCRAFVCEHRLELPHDAVQLIYENSREALAELSAEFFGHPEKKLHLIGVTGTKGKSTVAAFIHQILNQNGIRCGMIGTTGAYINGIRRPTANTTPESRELSQLFSEMLANGEQYVVMEISSQAYLTGRVRGLYFDVAVFTNLSEDHIGPGEHKDFADYLSCKAKLFRNCAHAVVNIDDEYTPAILVGAKCSIEGYGIRGETELNTEVPLLLADNITKWKHDGAMGIGFDYSFGGIRYTTALPMPGEFNIYNALAAAAVCRYLGVPHSRISEALERVCVSGRFEIVLADTGTDAVFVIDYAHNGLSLRSVLKVIREYRPERVVCLFGSVGGRTELRRAELGKVAAELADFSIITSDNPDYEDPEAIIADITKAADEVDGAKYKEIPDRREAVEYAVRNARNGDIVLFAGKGHEDYQLVKGKKMPFNEREIILETARQIKEIQRADIKI